MKAIVFSKEKQQLLEKELPTPTPEKEEVLVKVDYVLLLQRDLEQTSLSGEIIPGRFFVGEVIATGNDVKNYAPGDIVSVIPLIHCESCEFCESSEYHLCEKPSIPGRDTQGFLSEFVTVRADFLFKIPPEIPKKRAVFIPLLVELISYIPETIQPGSTGIVAASGLEGIIFNSLLHLSGIIETTILSSSQRLRSFIKPDLRTLFFEEPQGTLKFFKVQGIKPDFAFDFTGNRQFLKGLLQILKPGGTLFLTKIPVDAVEREILEVAVNNNLKIGTKNLLSLKVKVSYAIKILQTHAICLEDFITHVFIFSDYEKITKILLLEPSLVMINFENVK